MVLSRLSEAARWTRRAWLGSMGASLLVAASVGPVPALAQSKALVPVRFTLDWRFEGPAAPFLVAIEKGYFKDEGLDVTIDTGNGSREAIPRVASGTYQMGFGDFNSLIRFRDENPDVGVKAVMMVYDRPPFAIVGRKSRGISKDLESLKGKKFGAPAADAAYAQWPIFREVNKIDEKEWKLRFENVGFPVREPMLAQGEVDAVFGFSMSSAINLKARGVPEDDIVVMNMSDYGVELYGNVIMANQAFMDEKPEAVRGFLRAFMKGMKDTLANPDQAVVTVLKRNDVARKDVELDRLKMTIENNFVTPEVKQHGFGSIQEPRFDRAMDQIGLTFTYKNRPKMADVFTDAFLPSAAERKID